MAALTEEIIDSLSKEQKMNLKKIADLADREQNVYNKMVEIFKRGSYVEAGAVVPCEDMDDFTVANAFRSPENQHPVYREFVETKKQIKETLEESVRLKMGNLGLIQRQCKNYGVKI